MRRASRNLKSDFPRCSWHWQFVCERCWRNTSFHGVAWCETGREFLCVHCAPEHRKAASPFWAWDYYYEIWCERCSDYHATLDWMEYRGRHPWQLDDSARRTLKGLSGSREIKPWGWLKWAPEELRHPPLDDVQKGWDDAAEIWDSGYGKYGDSYRMNLFNPVLFPLLGDVKGKKVLDAGCGAGYLSRLLAEMGARMTGVDFSESFIRIAKRYEEENPRGITYARTDLADLSELPSASFDLVVSMYVLCDVRDYEKAIAEISRVLKPGGRFVFLIAHPCFGWHAGAWERIPADSQRCEDSLYFKVDEYFREGAQESQWGKLPVLLSFQRPLSGYFGNLKKHGFLVRDLLEPRPARESLEKQPRHWEKEDRIPPALIIEAVKPE